MRRCELCRTDKHRASVHDTGDESTPRIGRTVALEVLGIVLHTPCPACGEQLPDWCLHLFIRLQTTRNPLGSQEPGQNNTLAGNAMQLNRPTPEPPSSVLGSRPAQEASRPQEASSPPPFGNPHSSSVPKIAVLSSPSSQTRLIRATRQRGTPPAPVLHLGTSPDKQPKQPKTNGGVFQNAQLSAPQPHNPPQQRPPRPRMRGSPLTTPAITNRLGATTGIPQIKHPSTRTSQWTTKQLECAPSPGLAPIGTRAEPPTFASRAALRADTRRARPGLGMLAEPRYLVVVAVVGVRGGGGACLGACHCQGDVSARGVSAARGRCASGVGVYPVGKTWGRGGLVG